MQSSLSFLNIVKHWEFVTSFSFKYKNQNLRHLTHSLWSCHIYLRPIAKFQCLAWLGLPQADPGLWNYLAPPSSRCIDNKAVRDVCYLATYELFLFTQVDLVPDKADLAGIVIHKWVPMYGMYFILRFCPLNPAPGTVTWPSQACPDGPSTGIWLWALTSYNMLFFDWLILLAHCL